MKKIFILLIVIIGFVLFNIETTDKDVVKEGNKIDIVEETIKNMSIDEKIAQMLILEYDETYLTEEFKNIMEKSPPGGFIIMPNNITTYDNTKKLISDLKSISKIPMIISIDQEGGNVQRLKHIEDIDVLDIPYMYDIGKTKDKEIAYKTGKTLAQQLKTIGVNVVFAPVLDLYNDNNTVIGKRSFGSNKELVSKMALSLAKGLEDNDIIPVYKHFPGHGPTQIDSHISLPVISKTKEKLQDDLYPFIQAIKNDAKIMMIGHLSIPSITNSNEPASLSYEVITKLLINELNYKGLVITDALNMGALTTNYTDEEICIKAINAGADLLLMPNNDTNILNIIKENISEERIDISIRKIISFKFKYLKDYELLNKSYLYNNHEYIE